MLGMIVQLAASMRTLLQHAPINRLLRRLHQRGGLLSAVAAMLAGVAYLIAAVACTGLLEDGGPGWINLLVLLFMYNAFKLALHGLVVLVAPAWQRLFRRRPSRAPDSLMDEPGGGLVPQR